MSIFPELKKFYKNATITHAEGGGFEVNLDKRKLKTPMGNIFKVPNEGLAMAVAGEWNAQDKIIKKYNMHITALANTAIDNPTHRTRDQVINGILEYLDTDTLCYRVEHPQELVDLQTKEWDAILNWIMERYHIYIEATTGFGVPTVPTETREIFRQHLQSFNDFALVGYQQAVEVVRSIFIAYALIDRHISVEKAVNLSRLELDFQTEKWGNVEWHHDVDLYEYRARLASAALFVYLNSNESRTVFTKRSMEHPI
ncbi:hypothetical protein CAPTEDRAFT_114697 [Capitella teleta]|uniref:ATP synthase mitochondrial F1 complex assembly factor 2 n=1 Tax=Capitella teleta TaxID=283909 RepID=R7V7B5_CAPTE|nr:hypothetical protein CAPTEDRAFT_114697 [Capitella teleta]|eukprot:ELU12261.1 hypothetical protein CAPTEDRAFT_114697 [Capitella teleta]